MFIKLILMVKINHNLRMQQLGLSTYNTESETAIFIVKDEFPFLMISYKNTRNNNNREPSVHLILINFPKDWLSFTCGEQSSAKLHFKKIIRGTSKQESFEGNYCNKCGGLLKLL